MGGGVFALALFKAHPQKSAQSPKSWRGSWVGGGGLGGGGGVGTRKVEGGTRKIIIISE